MVKLNLNISTRKKATAEPVVKSCDLLQIFVQNGHEKRGKWLLTRVMQEVDSSPIHLQYLVQKGTRLLLLLKI